MRTITFSFVLALSLLSLLFFVSVAPALSQSPSLPQPVITSISGCTDIGTTTWNCSVGSTVTVTGLNFVDDPRASMSSDDVLLVCVVNHPVTNTSFTCYLDSVRPPTWPGNTLERSVVSFPSVNLTSPPFYGFAMTHTDMPYMASIYGCDDSSNSLGQYTQNCVPDQTTLTVVGLHFLVIPTMPSQSISVRIAGRSTMASPQVLNDTVMTIRLSAFYARLLIPDHYQSTPLPIAIVCGWYVTNALNVSLVSPIPPPQVTSINNLINPASGGCASRNVTTGLAMLGCIPGVSPLLIVGHYFYQPMQVYVGGQPCPIQGLTTTQITCLLPVIPNYVPGQLYDLVLNDSVYADDGEVGVVLQAVSFQGGAVLVSALPCAVGCGIAISAKCQAGQALTIQGVGFTSDPTAYMTLTNSRSGWTGNCTALAEVDQYTYACTLPALPTAEAALQPTAMTVTLTSQGVTSSPLVVYAYDSATPIQITGVQGCGQQVSAASDGSVVIAGCTPTDWLTLIGQNFVRGSQGAPPTLRSVDATLTMTVPALNATALTGYLPGRQINLQYGVPIPFVVRTVAQGCSNPFNVTFTGLPPPPTTAPTSSSSSGSNGPSPPPSASSSNGLSGGAIAGVVIAAVVVAALLLAFLALRGGQWGKGYSGSREGGSGRLSGRASQYSNHQDSDFEMQPTPATN